MRGNSEADYEAVDGPKRIEHGLRQKITMCTSGEVITYHQLSNLIGQHATAVVQCNNSNPTHIPW